MNGKGVPEIDRMAVKITHLNQLLSLTGEIIITASNMAILQRHLQGQTQVMDKDSMEMIKNATLTSHRISSDLHHLVMDIRLVPVRETFSSFSPAGARSGEKKGTAGKFRDRGRGHAGR